MRAKSSRPGRLADTLQRVVGRIDPDKRLEVYHVWTFWDDEVGPSIAERAQPLSFRDGVLSVQVNSHSWLQELQFMKQTMREKLNLRLGADLIRDIYFVFGSAPQRALARPDEPHPPLRAIPTLPPLRDENLGKVFERLVRAHARRPTRSR